jgi:D-glycero-beta-D-manno-heptose 1-phosphate adenylyltransferase
VSTLPEFVLNKLIPAKKIDRGDWSVARPLVFTNGVFDVLHRGHVVYLGAARALGATLLVGVNTDTSARQLGKGPGRPVNGEEDRVAVLAALQSVSYVTLFDEATPCELIRRCRPEIYVKGGDYDVESLDETRLVRSWGGRSLAIPFVPGYSSSALLQRLCGAPGPWLSDDSAGT